MAKKKQKTQEELIREKLQRDIQNMERSIELGIIPLNPTRTFEIGERVELGAHKEVYIRMAHRFGGLFARSWYSPPWVSSPHRRSLETST